MKNNGRPEGLRYTPAAMILTVCLASVALVAQNSGGLNPADLLKPLADSWPSYSGDYTGRRYSALTQVNQSTVKQLTLAFTATLSGGEGSGDVVVGGGTTIKGSILAVNNVLYVTAPDNVWALDAHDGREIWHYFWKTKG